MSSHVCPTFRFNLSNVQKHPDADRLGIFKIDQTEYNYILNLEDWKDRDGILVSWVIPDSLVDTRREEFSFLMDLAKYDDQCRKGGYYHRVKARRLRSLISYGLLVPAPQGLSEGDDASEALGIVHYNKPEDDLVDEQGKVKVGSNEEAPAPSQFCPDYDLESFQKYARKLFVDGETVVATQKIHGESSRYLFDGERMNVGSHHKWKKEYASPANITIESLMAQGVDEERAKKLYEDKVVNFKSSRNKWWEAMKQHPEVEEFCRANPGYCLYAEKAGNVPKMAYGMKNGQMLLMAFDLLTPEGVWMNYDDARKLTEKYKIKWVPEVYRGLFDVDKIIPMAEFKSGINGATHIAEGIVVEPLIQRTDPKHGRCKLKVVSSKYLEGDFD